MSKPKYDFLFFRLGGAPDALAWAEFAINQVVSHSEKVSLVGGKKTGWVKAPKDAGSLATAVTQAKNRSVQGGGNPGSRDPIDGWGIYCANPSEADANLCRYRNDEESLADWFERSARSLLAFSDITYGFGYSGGSPKDVFFGLGMSAGKPSAELSGYFSDEEKVARWFRACMWNTDADYVRDAFPVNLLHRRFVERAVPGIDLAMDLSRHGDLARISDDHYLWLISDEARRIEAAAYLGRNELSIVSHAYGTLSQVKPHG